VSGPRVLFVTPTTPWPANSGGRIRTSQLIEHAGREARITLFAVSPSQVKEPAPRPLMDRCEGIEVFDRTRPGLLARFALSKLERSFHSDRLHSAVQAALSEGSYDLVHIDELSVARAVGFSRSSPVLVHHHKLDSKLAAELARLGEGVGDGEVARIRALERRVCRTHSYHAACSKEEARSLSEEFGVQCAVVPNGFDSDHFTPSEESPDQDTALFLGTLSYAPNIHGLEWFVGQVLPLVRANRPEFKLKIVGIDPSPRVLALRSEHVEVIGPVRDPLEHLHSAACSIAPLFIGGGTRIKILESLAAACPVVSTTVGAAGLTLPPGSTLIADDAASFSAALLTFLNDQEEARALAMRASEQMHQHYSWGASASALLDAWEDCASKTPR
jgi:glycosyltransferase involved in cell wall biosynthesis